ncbi:MAG: hypothetical protein ACO331_15690 [Prochlorothrix sp.]
MILMGIYLAKSSRQGATDENPTNLDPVNPDPTQPSPSPLGSLQAQPPLAILKES